MGRLGYELGASNGLVAKDVRRLSDIPDVDLRGLDDDSGSIVELQPDFRAVHRLTLRFKSSRNNYLYLGAGSSVFGDFSFTGEDNTIIFAGDHRGAGLYNIHMTGRGCTCFVGARTSSNGISIDVIGNDQHVVIGEDALIAHNVRVMTSDMHALIDCGDGRWLNTPASVLIEPHVWLARQSTVLKGSTIGFGSVLGFGAVLSGELPRRAVAAGIPATVRRTNASWLRPGEPGERALGEFRDLERRLEV